MHEIAVFSYGPGRGMVSDRDSLEMAHSSHSSRFFQSVVRCAHSLDAELQLQITVLAPPQFRHEAAPPIGHAAPGEKLRLGSAWPLLHREVVTKSVSLRVYKRARVESVFDLQFMFTKSETNKTLEQPLNHQTVLSDVICILPVCGVSETKHSGTASL